MFWLPGSSHGIPLPPYLSPSRPFMVVEGSRSRRGIQPVYVLGVTYMVPHLADLLLWTVGVQPGKHRRVVWTSKPRDLGGVGGYSYLGSSLPMYDPPDASVSADGMVAGTMSGWWNNTQLAWCQTAPAAACWGTNYRRHGFVYSGGKLRDLNQLVVNRRNWVIEGVQTASSADLEGPANAIDAHGDIIAIGYRTTPDRSRIRDCRTNPAWRAYRRLCVLSASRSPEQALLLKRLN